MKRRRITKFFPVLMVVAIGVLSQLIAQNIVDDDQLIQIFLIGFFLCGIITHWIIVKMEIH
ncbi:hypothetical protein [Methanohalophilus portucalensis]|uniref:Uncharacterized protein n=3 Tax=Methanohalophilus portucalensis TaxID=39664 RepID=A0A3M9LJH8_9EURY|nr:hypothetical protein [Methanohalophilus portucalensis]ATU08380.1 hypothetical protein BKM01_06100 [Methanohalophilus portucalensis]RNI13452.1 hypothetical protein EFE41_02420 [Methanohalophilus portucalensis FDF-1]